MMVQSSGSLVESASVPRIPESEVREIEVMAELMAECAQERADGGNFLAHRGSHPYPNYH